MVCSRRGRSLILRIVRRWVWEDYTGIFVSASSSNPWIREVSLTELKKYKCVCLHAYVFTCVTAFQSTESTLAKVCLDALRALGHAATRTRIRLGVSAVALYHTASTSCRVACALFLLLAVMSQAPWPSSRFNTERPRLLARVTIGRDGMSDE